MLQNLRRRLGWKLFLSYLLVILVGILVLTAAAEIAIPASFNRHMAGMMGGEGMMSMMGQMESGLFSNFRSAFTEALLLGTLAAVLAAALASYFITRRVISPVEEMTRASERIAAGRYEERVPLRAQPGQEDELASLAVSFNKMADRLEQTETMRRRLIGDIAHELRTPLTTIKGYVEAMIDGVLPADEATLQQVYRESDRLQRLVQDLQVLSRVESPAFSLQRDRLEVAPLLQLAHSRLAAQFDEKGVGLGLENAGDLPAIQADEDRLVQVLTNLLGNALQYTDAGGQVTLSAHRQGAEVHITVRDTGIGIAAEHLPHIFERFYRVDKSRARAAGGSGIGLTIARNLVEAHGGRIWAQSAGAGRGSTLTFTLPVGAEPPDQSRSTTTSP